MSFKRIAVGISGSGRSLDNLLKKQDNFRFKIVGVVSSNPNCRGNEIAKESSLPVVIYRFPRESDAELSRQILKQLNDWQSDGVVLAGFLKHWPSLANWSDRVINIHPALLPKYGGPGMYGLNVHKAVISEGETSSGATVHWVDDIYDNGGIISQVELSIRSGDTATGLADRIFRAECDLLPKTIDRLAGGDLPLANSHIWRYDFDES